MILKRKIDKALRMPPKVLLKKVAEKARRYAAYKLCQLKDHTRPTFGEREVAPLRFHLKPLSAVALENHRDTFETLANYWLDHQFNLLGSGWKKVVTAGDCHELNQSNRKEAQRIRRLIDPSYLPIDWHVDFKSGFRWDPATWFKNIRFGCAPGVDVKVPWELARMQHLPVLALAYALAKARPAGDLQSERLAAEIRNQILDFIAANPPRFGVNWECAMDVAIRAVTWIITIDLMQSHGWKWDEPFQAELARSLHAHGRYLRQYHSWNEELRGNHYLAEIVGLLFIASTLPAGPETNEWRTFSRQELVAELQTQFHADGTNFEASTSYHRLSAEMAVFAVALLGADDGLESIPLPIIQRLQRMAEFAIDVTRPDGRVIQVGDNDSGRFLRLTPLPENPANNGPSTETHRDHRPLVSAISGLFDRKDFTRFAEGITIEREVVRSLMRGRTFATTAAPAAEPKTGVWQRDYPDFGLFIRKFGDIYLAIRCGTVGQNNFGGHAHNDQLSFELAVGGHAVVVDPGTYVYTPWPEERNLFRSTGLHNTLAIAGVEQNHLTREELFRLLDRCRARVLESSERRFAGTHTGFGVPHQRTFDLSETELAIRDECALEAVRSITLCLDPKVTVLGVPTGIVRFRVGALEVELSANSGHWEVHDGKYSPEYGVVVPTTWVTLRSTASNISWKVQWTR